MFEAEENWGEEINCHQMGGSDEVEGEGQASFRFFSSHSLLTSIQHVGSIPCGSFRGLPILCVSRILGKLLSGISRSALVHTKIKTRGLIFF